MKIIRARVLGFCMGVRRAVDIAEEEAAKSADVYTLGPLIHNPRVLADLKNLGVRPIDSSLLQEIDFSRSSVIIRAHGISPEAERKLREKGCRVIDATCPKVKASQLKVKELSENGFFLFLAGDAEHAEIEGLRGYSSDSRFCKVIGNVKDAGEEAAALYRINSEIKTALLGQTTISEEEYSNITLEIKKYFPDLEVIQTICGANERQKALRELLQTADAVIIAGGRDSANTRRLLAIAEQSGKPCVLAQDKSEIPGSFREYGKVGLCAGASTPDSVIDEIERELTGISHFT